MSVELLLHILSNKAALRKRKREREREQGYRMDVGNIWHFHSVKREHEACDNLTKSEERKREVHVYRRGM